MEDNFVVYSIHSLKWSIGLKCRWPPHKTMPQTAGSGWFSLVKFLLIILTYIHEDPVNRTCYTSITFLFDDNYYYNITSVCMQYVKFMYHHILSGIGNCSVKQSIH